MKQIKLQFTMLIFTIVNFTIAQENPWVNIGPNGADVNDIAIDPTATDRLIITTDKAYIRTAPTSPWTLIDNLNNQAPSGITSIEANANGVFFAAGSSTTGVIYKSTDGGTTWSLKNLNVVNGVLNIIIDPNNPDVIYATTTSDNSGNANHVIFKSIDTGETWSPINMVATIPQGRICTSLAVDPNDSNVIVALGSGDFAFDSVVVRSVDGGVTWTDITATLEQGTEYNDVDIDANGAIYLSGGHPVFPNNVVGVQKSTDNGATWQEMSVNFPVKYVNSLAIHPSNSNMLYAATEGGGVYSSTDAGATWDYNIVNSGFFGGCRIVVLNPNNPSQLFATYYGIGVTTSNDAGINWTADSIGLNEVFVNGIEIDPSNSGTIIAAYEGFNTGGCFIYNNTTANWTPAKMPAPRFTETSIATDGAMYAWSLGPTSIGQDGLYKSTDNGLTWVNQGPDIGPYLETEILDITISATNPNTIFISGHNFGVNGFDSVIYKSTNGGNTWTNVYTGISGDKIRYIHIDPNSSDTIIYAALQKPSGNSGFLKSTDGGNTWSVINFGIASTAKWSSCIVTAPDNSNTLYGAVGGSTGIPRTIYRSTDGGNLWFNLFLPASSNQFSKITDIVIDPVNTDLIYVSTTQDGMYMSNDGGTTWALANNGLTETNITDLSNIYVDANGQLSFFAATYGGGVFSQQMNSTLSINDHQIASNISVYPNPAYSKVNIALNNKTLRKINLYSISGALIFSKDYGNQLSNTDVNTSNFAEGLYLLEIITEDNISMSQKLIISKK
jgi:photosystem II stability/assembly factor-like uncharacterized protein